MGEMWQVDDAADTPPVLPRFCDHEWQAGMIAHYEPSYSAGAGYGPRTSTGYVNMTRWGRWCSKCGVEWRQGDY